MMTILEKAKNVMLEVLFPVMCFGCGKEGTYICTRCSEFVDEASLVCPECEESTYTGEAHATCKGRYALDGLIGVWEYEGVAKELLLQIKYRGIAHAAQEITELAFFVMAKDTARFSAFLSFLLEKDTALAFVPMWKPKERKRGHNQAASIARALGTLRQAQCQRTPEEFLQKIKDTKSQTALKEKERLQNVKDSFEFKSEIRNTKSETNSKFQIPKNVVLVDDVWTTGATMRECCKVLKKAGVEKVWGFTLARTV